MKSGRKDPLKTEKTHIYYGANEGVYPDDLSELKDTFKYIKEVPVARAVGYHPATNAQQLSRDNPVPDDSGGWFYDNMSDSQSYGKVVVNCTHTDAKGSVWSTN